MQVEQTPVGESVTRLRALLAANIRELVDVPDSVVIEAVQNGTLITFHVLVPPDELGKVVGMRGRTARCLRTILGSVATKYKLVCILDIKEID